MVCVVSTTLNFFSLKSIWILNGNFSGAIGPNITLLSVTLVSSGLVYTDFNPLSVITNFTFNKFSGFWAPSV